LNPVPLYPLRFDPFFQYRPWGGRRLAEVLSITLPGEDLVGEAWILSDRDEHSSVVSNGPLRGMTLGQLVNDWPNRMLGNRHGVINRFPLLLKFLDVRAALSVQVHPSDRQTNYLPDGESGKTEAWIVLGVGKESLIYAGLTAGTTPNVLREALAEGSVTRHVASFVPSSGDAVFIPAGVVHSLRDVVIFEVQQNSNVTFRLYDWNQIDPKTLEHRPLQVEQAMACIDFTQGAITPIVPLVQQLEPVLREQLFDCEQFGLWRLGAKSPFAVGSAAAPRVLVCIAGEGHVTQNGADVSFSTGDVLFLPAEVGACSCRPNGNVELLEMSLPHGSPSPVSSP
jgi:mannose-6-phosphate isomerase